MTKNSSLPNYISNRQNRERQEFPQITSIKKETDEFTNSLISDNATKKFLDEAEASTNLSQFDFGDITEYLQRLENLSFLEAVSFKKKIDLEISRWKSCSNMLETINDLKLDDNINKEIMRSNTMADYNFLQSSKDFEKHYEVNLDKLIKISNKLMKIIDEHKEEMNSTKFLSDEMIHLMSGKLNKLNPNNLNFDYNRIRMQEVIIAFSNRLNIDFLKHKLSIYLKTNKSNILRDFKDNYSILKSNRRTKAINDLIRLFNENITYDAYMMLLKAFNNDINAVYVMLVFVAKIMNSEKKSGKDVWAKVFMLNLSDISNNIFDIDDKHDNYLNKVSREFYPLIENFLSTQKMKKKIESQITFGLTKNNNNSKNS